MPDLRQPLGPIVLNNISQDSYTVCWVKPNITGSVGNFHGFLIESSSDNVKWTKTAEVDRTVTSFTIKKYNTNASQFIRVFCRYNGGISRPLTSCDLKNVIAAKIHTLNQQKNVPTFKSNSVKSSSGIPTKPATQSNLNTTTKSPGMPSNTYASKGMPTKSPGTPSNTNASKGLPTKSPGTPSNTNASKGLPTKSPGTPSNTNASKGIPTKSPGTPSNTNASKGLPTKSPGTPSNTNASKGLPTKSPGTPSNTNASKGIPTKSPGTPSNTNASKGLPSKVTGAPTNVNASKVSGISSKVDIKTEATESSGSQNDANASKAMPSGMNTSKAQGTPGMPSNINTSKAANSADGKNMSQVTKPPDKTSGIKTEDKGSLLSKPGSATQPKISTGVVGASPTKGGLLPTPLIQKAGLLPTPVCYLMPLPYGPSIMDLMAGTNLPQKAGTNLPQMAGTNLPQKAGTNLPQKAGTNLPQKAGTNLPQKAGTNLPQKAGTNLPQKAGTNLPQKAGTNLPQKAGTNLPQKAGTNLPQKAGTNLPQETMTGNLKKPCGPLVVVSASSERFSVKWCIPTPAGPGLKGFLVERSRDNLSWSKVADVGKAASVCTITGGVVGKSQYVRVFAVYDGGRSDPLVSCDLVDVIAAKTMVKQVAAIPSLMETTPIPSNKQQASFQMPKMLRPVGSYNNRMQAPASTNDNRGNPMTSVENRVGQQKAPCRYFPTCNQKRCRFRHPPCPNPNCRGIDCNYSHERQPADTGTEVGHQPDMVSPRQNVRCPQWPNCNQRDTCTYIHPTKPCKKFPNCRFGEACSFIHPPCSKGVNCNTPGCQYSHVKQKTPLLGPPMRRNMNEEATSWTGRSDSDEARFRSTRNNVNKEQVRWPSSAQASDDRFESSQKAGPKAWPNKECPDLPYCQKGANCQFIHPRQGTKRHAPPGNQISSSAVKSIKSDNDTYARQYQDSSVGQKRNGWQKSTGRISDEYANQERQNRTRNQSTDAPGKFRDQRYEGPEGMYAKVTRGREMRSTEPSAGGRYLTEEEAYNSDRWAGSYGEEQFGDKWNQRKVFDYSEKKRAENVVKEQAYSTRSQDISEYSHGSKYPLLPYPQGGYEADPKPYSQAPKPLIQSRERRMDASLERKKPLLTFQQDEWLPYDQSMHANPRRAALLSSAEREVMDYRQSVYDEYNTAARRPDIRDEELASRRPEGLSRRPEPLSRRPEPLSRRPEPLSRRPEPLSRRPEPLSRPEALSRPEPLSRRTESSTYEDEWTYGQRGNTTKQGDEWGYEKTPYAQPSGAARSQRNDQDLYSEARSRRGQSNTTTNDEWSAYGPYAGSARNPTKKAVPDDDRAYDQSVYGQQQMASSRREISSDKYSDGGWYAGDQGYQKAYAEKMGYPYPMYESDMKHPEAKLRKTEVYDYDAYGWR